MRMTFDARSNNKIRDMISKYDNDDSINNSKYESSKYDKYDKSNVYSPKAPIDKSKYRNAEL